MKHIYYFVYAFLCISFLSCNKVPELSKIELGDELPESFKTSIFTSMPEIIPVEGWQSFINLATSKPWSINSVDSKSISWITFEPANGNAGAFEIKVTVHENQSYDQRTAVIVLTCGDEKYTIPVKQEQLYNLSLEKNEYNIDSEKQNLSIELNSNVDFHCKIDDACSSWIEVVATKAYSKHSIDLSISENISTDSRDGIVSITWGGHSESVKIHQDGKKRIPANGVSLNKTELELFKGQSSTLIATVLPENADNKIVSWHSSNSDIASVSSNGLVYANGIGETIVTVETDDGGFTASCKVVVKEKPYPLVKKVVFEDGHSEIFEYDDSGRIHLIKDAQGNIQAEIRYDLDEENNGTIFTDGWWGNFTIKNSLCTNNIELGDFAYVSNHLSQWRGGQNWTQDYIWNNDCLTMINTKTAYKTYEDPLEYYDMENPFADQTFDLNFALLSDIFSGQMPYIYGWFGKGSSKLLKSSANYRFFEYTWTDGVLTKVTITAVNRKGETDYKRTISIEYYD